MSRVSVFSLSVATALSLLAGDLQGQASQAGEAARTTGTTRLEPYPVTLSSDYERALEHGTRSPTGAPGPGYWQQWADYRIETRLDPVAKELEGSVTIVYQNNSPDTLDSLYVNLYQNLHALGAPRKVPQEVTGGVDLRRIVIDGTILHPRGDEGAGFTVDGTRLGLWPQQGIEPGKATTLEIDWAFKVPQAGAANRMGWDADDLFFIAYWYPQMAVYDDVVGWQTDWFMGRAEFYNGFASYDLTVEVPEGWVVMATGRLQNPEEVLAPQILDRLRRAEESDGVVHVITADDFGLKSTRRAEEGWLRWRFRADTVRDVAFSASRASFWDAARTPVGDRDGDGSVDYTRVDAFYRELAPRWKNAARYAQHSIRFLSEHTGFPYPWPHMTAVEGSNIIAGGMEFPMLTLIGDYNERSDSALYYVTVHELGHMWYPMIVGNDERRYSWMDEGTTTFNENQARKDFFPGVNHDIPDQETYAEMALSGDEGEMMRRSDYHYTRDAFTVASYSKPASALVALRGLLGDETFARAYQTYMNRWAYKHPYPWDLFNTFASVSGRDLDWFWRSWYYETWTLDQAIASVTSDGDGIHILVEDRGQVPMPTVLTITLKGGEVMQREVPVETWLKGATQARVDLPPGTIVERAEIDAARAFPDVDRGNNVWER